MSNQPESKTLTPEEIRQAILNELEASQQEIAEISDEQLEEIAGGALSDIRANISWIRQKGQISGVKPQTREYIQGFIHGINGIRIR
jgi:vacuolar-type H+-ATPase subunit H